MPDELLPAIANGNADLVSFGALFLANRDLPERLRLNTALNDRSTFYGGDEKGYTNYEPIPLIP
ncbi:hypothetical protein FACHB389_31290 [Nostoc calcicola FACHB-389]|nr:hypothetical protein FACHB389_31290 [Nostoc calcicola FACHB-389]